MNGGWKIILYRILESLESRMEDYWLVFVKGKDCCELWMEDGRLFCIVFWKLESLEKNASRMEDYCDSYSWNERVAELWRNETFSSHRFRDLMADSLLLSWRKENEWIWRERERERNFFVKTVIVIGRLFGLRGWRIRVTREMSLSLLDEIRILHSLF